MIRGYIIASITRDDRDSTAVTSSRSLFGSCRWYHITRNPNTDVIFYFERSATLPDGGVPYRTGDWLEISFQDEQRYDLHR
jgi:hypothetical protein